ncbi:MAG TPA: hypothetical protein VHE60_03390 [Pyrinomonadaceae bacterium]|nr:hypothetical protein [Pyrinomonadaceae bacterium]
MRKALTIFVLLLFCSCARNPTSSSNSQASAPFNPKVGDHVLAHWGSETYEPATIKAIEGDRATIVFDGAAKEDYAKFPSEMMAIPTAPVKVATGDYVLAQYPFQKQMWIGGRVNSVGGATVNVKFSNTNADSDVPANMLVKAPEAEIPAIKKELNQ